MLLTIIVFVLILSILILIHEGGHFISAKIFGIKVEEFGFGLPPRIFGKKFGETIYSVNWLPIGGFVKLYGEDEAGAGKPSFKVQSSKLESKDEKRAFFAKPVWQRAVVIFAGVFMNFALAVAILSFLFSVVGVPISGNKVNVDVVVKNSPAEKAGLKAGDTVESINGVSITSTTQLITITKKHLGQKLTLEVKTQNSKVKSIEITPRKVYPANEGAMGIAISQNSTIKKYPWYEAPFVGTKEALHETYLIANGLVMIVVQLFTKGSIPSDVAGPIGIAQLTGVVVSNGIYAVLSFVALLSLNLALVNVLPIPALDGGRLLFILIEGVFRKKVDQKIEGYAHAVGMAVLLGLIALITLHDLFRIFTGQPLLPK
jgi:regulator of sigma E protease